MTQHDLLYVLDWLRKEHQKAGRECGGVPGADYWPTLKCLNTNLNRFQEALRRSDSEVETTRWSNQARKQLRAAISAGFVDYVRCGAGDEHISLTEHGARELARWNREGCPACQRNVCYDGALREAGETMLLTL